MSMITQVKTWVLSSLGFHRALLFIVRSLSSNDATAARTWKNNRFSKQNNNFARASHFLYISLPFLHDYNVKMPNFAFEGDFTRDDSQRRFLAQHSITMLEQCCNYSKQCCSNVATPCCTKHSITMLEQCCNYLKQCCSNVATPCCTKHSITMLEQCCNYLKQCCNAVLH